MPDNIGALKAGSDAMANVSEKMAALGSTVVQTLKSGAREVGQAINQADQVLLKTVPFGLPLPVASAVVIAALARAPESLLARDKPQGPDHGTFEDLVKREPGDYVFLLETRAGTNIDWSNPTALSRSTAVAGILLKTCGTASAIGHAQVAWAYTDEQGHAVFGAAGQTGGHGPEGLKATLAGWGLSVMGTVFLDGKLENEQIVLDRTKLADEQNDLAWVAIKTDRKTCEKMAEFVQEYARSGAAKNYGFPVDPLKFEGAGCTSFADAAFYKTGLNIPLFEASKRQLKIPLKYVGVLDKPIPNTRPPMLAAGPEDEKKVSASDLFFGNTSWASASEPHRDFAFYDPELYFESLASMENVYRQKEHMAPKAYARTTEDEAQIKARKTSEAWMNSLLEKHVPVKIENIHHTSGLIIDLTGQRS